MERVVESEWLDDLAVDDDRAVHSRRDLVRLNYLMSHARIMSGLLAQTGVGGSEFHLVELGAGVRPAFADNVPRIFVQGRTIHVNGAYRHGFMLAPVMAAAVRDYITGGVVRADLMTIEA